MFPSGNGRYAREKGRGYSPSRITMGTPVYSFIRLVHSWIQHPTWKPETNVVRRLMDYDTRSDGSGGVARGKLRKQGSQSRSQNIRNRNYSSIQVVKTTSDGLSVEVNGGGVALWTALEVRMSGVRRRYKIKHD